MRLSKRFAVFLINIGAKIYFKNEEDTELLKKAINTSTTIGSYADSGDHLRGTIVPMNDYDTQSVINVLKSKALLKKQNDHSIKENYYTELWNYK